MLNNLSNNSDRAIEMLKTFKKDGISHVPSKGLDLVIEWQDIVGRSTMSDIVKFFTDDLAESRYRDNFHWVNMNCLDQATAIEILKKTTLAAQLLEAHKNLKAEYKLQISMMTDQVTYLQGEVDELRKASLSHQDTICDMEEQKKADDRSMRIMSEDIEHLRASGRDLNAKAAELETIKKAFAILNK